MIAKNYLYKKWIINNLYYPTTFSVAAKTEVENIISAIIRILKELFSKVYVEETGYFPSGECSRAETHFRQSVFYFKCFKYSSNQLINHN